MTREKAQEKLEDLEHQIEVLCSEQDDIENQIEYLDEKLKRFRVVVQFDGESYSRLH